MKYLILLIFLSSCVPDLPYKCVKGELYYKRGNDTYEKLQDRSCVEIKEVE